MLMMVWLLLMVLGEVQTEEPQEIITEQVISYRVTSNFIPEYENVPAKFFSTIPLEVDAEILKKCQIIGGISQINTQSDPNLQINLEYSIQPESKMIKLYLTFRSHPKPSLDFYLTLDFLIARFPSQFIVQSISILPTSSKKITAPELKKSGLLMFVNGWSSLALSGYINATYSQKDKMFLLGFQSGRPDLKRDDFINMMTLVGSQDIMLLSEKNRANFTIHKPNQGSYFYGIQGLKQSKFKGEFSIGYNTFNFHTPNPISYNLQLLKIPQPKIEERRHANTFQLPGLLITAIVFIIFNIVIYWIIMQKKKGQFKNEQVLESIVNLKEEESQKSTKKSMTNIEPILEVQSVLEESHGLSKIDKQKVEEIEVKV